MNRTTYTFEEHEDKGRVKFEKVFGRFPHEFTKDKYAFYDAVMTAYTVPFIVEIKNKEEPIEKWEEQGFILEINKYNKMVAFCKNSESKMGKGNGVEPLYVNFFNNGDGFYCNLFDLDPKWEWRYCTSTSADGTYGKEKEWKYVTMIPPEIVTKFKYE